MAEGKHALTLTLDLTSVPILISPKLGRDGAVRERESMSAHNKPSMSA